MFGAPQEHGQRLYQQDFEEVWDQKENTYNPNWGYWNGEQEWERVNF